MQMLFQFLWSIIGLFQFWTIVDQYEKGVVLRFGKFNRVIEPGFHWLLPFGIDRALTHEVILTTRETSEQSLVTADNRKVVISTIVAYTLVDIRKILLEIEEAETVLENFVYGEISRMVTEWEYVDIMSEEFRAELLTKVQTAAILLGMKVEKIEIVNFCELKTIRLMLPTNDISME